MQTEIWKTIDGYENYQVSNLGNVRNVKKNKILKLGLNTYGYYRVSLYKNGVAKSSRVHQLVAIAFLNHIPCGMNLVVDHINDIKTDNRVENLQLITNRENVYKTQGKYSSKHKGVSWYKASNKWMSYIYMNGKLKHLGYFTSEIEASQAYQNAINKIK